jgi:hypothetical protein
MSILRNPTKLRKALEHKEASHNADQWRRWDEELVDEFGRWLSRLAKAFAILLLAVVIIQWFWKRF